MSRATIVFVALGGAVACAFAAWAYLFWVRNGGTAVDVDLIFATWPELPVTWSLAGAALTGLFVGLVGGAAGLRAMLHSQVVGARRALAENRALKAELHAWRTLALEEPNFLSADSQGRPFRAPSGTPGSVGFAGSGASGMSSTVAPAAAPPAGPSPMPPATVSSATAVR